eukprot:TRINITY_DN64481_c0_g1_i1.p1 TRINITY_DN64481_c0_g1~~TRINITY_DN64481_c0_g1_i1.p1  ORF type:complete len:446 (-),score=117.26 TRINITY_DN64481_c0_g1_i1:300-1451(-)
MASTQAADYEQVSKTLKALATSSGGDKASPWKALAATLPHAALEPRESRHALQDELLNLVSESLKTCHAATVEEGIAVASKLETAKEAADKGEASVSEAALNETQKADALATCDSALNSAESSAKAAEADRADAEAAKAKASRKREDCSRECDEDSSIASGPLSLLTSGGWDDDETRDTVMEAVSGLLERAGAEPTLLAAMQGTYAQKPEKRRRFDKVVEESVADITEKRVVALKSALEAASQSAEDADAEALGLWAIADLAKEAASRLKGQAAQASFDLDEAKGQHAETKEALARLQSAFSALESEKKASEAKATEIAGALECLERLTSAEYSTNEEVSEKATADVEMEVAQADGTADIIQAPKIEALVDPNAALVPPAGGA